MDQVKKINPKILKPDMRILGIDPGSLTGYCLNTPFIFGHWDFKPHRYESGGMRYIRFRNKLDEIHTATKLDLVAFEEIIFHQTSLSAQVYGGLVSHLMVWAEENKVEYVGVNPGTWKRYVCGKGNAGKPKVAKAIQEQYDLNPQTFDESDAIGILKWAENEFIHTKK